MRSLFKKFEIRWLGGFSAANLILLSLISLLYLPFLPNFQQIPNITAHGVLVAKLFFGLAFVGQIGLVVIGMAALIWLVGLLRLPRLTMFIAIVLSSALCLSLITDLIVYHLYHFHFGPVFWHILRSGALSEVLVFSSREWLIAAAIVFTTIVIEVLLLLAMCRITRNRARVPFARTLLSFSLLGLFLSYLTYFAAITYPIRANDSQSDDYHLVTMEAQLVPLYTQLVSKMLPVKHSFSMLNDVGNAYFSQNAEVNRPLNYPKHLLQTKPHAKPYNIVFLTIDTWRYDAMNAKISPHIAAFAKQSLQFDDHYSGGNCTQPGIFSMFYGLPSPYWTAMKSQHHAPVLMRTLLHQGYQMGIFGSASLQFPDFKDTVFADVNGLQTETPGDSSAERDANITKEFRNFIDNRNPNKPFFSFLFYDEVHNWCGSSQPYAKPFQPAIAVCNRIDLQKDTNPVPYLNRYDNAVHYVDGLVGKDLELLKSQGLLKNTIVVITADHGEEFNDENLGYWGHASAYDPYQVHVPMIVYWPGKKPVHVHYRTNHLDIVPTLMESALGVQNPVNDYSVGQSLFKTKPQPFHIIGSYVDYAVVTPKEINVFYPEGNYDVQNKDGYSLVDKTPNPKLLRGAMRQLHEYFR